MNPKIPVLMALYNGGVYLKQSLESILNQAFRFKLKLAKRIMDSSYVDLGQGVLGMLNIIHESLEAREPKKTLKKLKN